MFRAWQGRVTGSSKGGVSASAQASAVGRRCGPDWALGKKEEQPSLKLLHSVSLYAFLTTPESSWTSLRMFQESATSPARLQLADPSAGHKYGRQDNW